MIGHTKSILLAAALPVAAVSLMLPKMLAQNPQAGGLTPLAGAQPTQAGAQNRQAGAQNRQGAPRPRSTVGSQGPMPEHAEFSTEQVQAGQTLFLQNCAFCHGKDADGGESGPDLTRSKLVASDKNGEAIGSVVRNGRPTKGMPSFSLAEAQIGDLVAFIHSKQDIAMSQNGNRKGVEESDLQTGNAAAGKRYFEGEGGCTKCHSATGDLAGIGTRYAGLRLEMQMLYPRDAKEKISVKTPTGENLTGTVEYHDEFTIGMRDSLGNYHSWPAKSIAFKIDDPLQAHVDALRKYTDDDIHNVFAYLETLK